MNAPEPLLESRAGATAHPWNLLQYPKPGVLRLDQDELTFTTYDNDTLFDTPLDGIQKIKAPWYQLGSGFYLTIAGRRYLVTFFRIPGASIVSGALIRTGNPVGEAIGVLGMIGTAGALLRGGQLGSLWLEVLRAHLPPEAGGSDVATKLARLSPNGRETRT